MSRCKPLIAGTASLLTLIGSISSPQRAHGATVTYNMNLTIGDSAVGIGTAIGSVETNGALGPLSAGDIVSWDLTITDGSAGSFNYHPIQARFSPSALACQRLQVIYCSTSAGQGTFSI